MEDITDVDYVHAKTVCEGFEIKNLWKYHNFHLKNDALLLAVVFENFRENMFKNLSFRSC